MELFEKQITSINTFLEKKDRENIIIKSTDRQTKNWVRMENKPLVLLQDTALELGHPQTASTSSLLWTNDEHLVHNGQISIIGQELSGLKKEQSPFGKIVLIAGDGFDDKNSYDRYREMEQIRYRLFLKGYMMRGASQFQREWSRVSKEAMALGFSLMTLGKELIDDYLKLSFVSSVQIIFITSSHKDVLEMDSVTTDVMKIIGAMNKMTEEMSFECDTCEYVDVCKEISALRAVRRKKEKQES